MGNKLITFMLLGVIILICILYFTAQSIVYPSGQPIISELNKVIQYVQKGEWDAAEESDEKIMGAWNRAKNIIALNYAEEDYSLFLENLTRIQGGIKTKDATETINGSLAMLKLWENFIRVIPQP